ncbi:MAG: hypothetical protein PF692_00305, partial [Kiritimatiellae bacterium]|nr:hypothetical protein [Kiritimatiellia bacterium]
MTSTVEAFRKILNFEECDRYPLMEWATWWDQTIARWEGEGLPKNMSQFEVMEYFGLDLHYQDWIRSVSPTCRQP